jgi:hypothetical protein
VRNRRAIVPEWAEADPKTARLIDWRAVTDPSVPFIDCAKTGIPEKVVHTALLRAAAECPPCSRCQGTCGCGRYLRDSLGIIAKYIREWEHRCWSELRGKVERSGIRSDVSDLLEDAKRRPEHRRPEKFGFEIDHAEGERWRRFNLLKTRGK